MKSAALTGIAVIAATAASAQQLLVFPAVTDERPGVNGSLWVTTAMVIKTDPYDEVTIRRKWVCLPNGGFVDDPATAPTWALEVQTRFGRLMYSLGGELLEGTGATAGAVALEVEGGEVIAHSNIMDIRWGDYRPYYREAFGQGQRVEALREPLIGPSHIPWLGGCRGTRCNMWQFQLLRNNIGIVNPNSDTLTITGTVLPFGYRAGEGQVPGIGEWDGLPVVETFSITVPPFGWQQHHWESTVGYGDDQFTVFLPHAGFVISLTPDREDLPYYAYASVVFSPDPDTGVPEFSDPMFVPAKPGYIVPIIEAGNAPWRHAELDVALIPAVRRAAAPGAAPR